MNTYTIWVVCLHMVTVTHHISVICIVNHWHYNTHWRGMWRFTSTTNQGDTCMIRYLICEYISRQACWYHLCDCLPYNDIDMTWYHIYRNWLFNANSYKGVMILLAYMHSLFGSKTLYLSLCIRAPRRHAGYICVWLCMKALVLNCVRRNYTHCGLFKYVHDIV
jgi:hypothetical protein